MYIETFDKSGKRPSRGITPKTPHSDVGPRSTRSNRLISSNLVADLSTTSFGTSPAPKSESKLFQLLRGGTNKAAREKLALNSTSDAFLASVVSQVNQPGKRSSRRSTLQPHTPVIRSGDSISSSSSIKHNTFVIADALSACKTRERAQLSQVYASSSANQEQKKSTRRQSASVIPANHLPEEKLPKALTILADDRFADMSYYSANAVPKSSGSSRTQKIAKAKLLLAGNTTQPVVPQIGVSNTTSAPRLSEVAAQKQPKRDATTSKNPEKPNGLELSSLPNSFSFEQSIEISYSTNLHPQGELQVKRLDKIQARLPNKTSDQRALIAATVDNQNPVDQIEELKQIYMKEQQNISEIISKGMKAIESKEMSKTIQQNPSTRFSEYEQVNVQESNISKEDLNKTGLLGAYQTYNRMSKHEIIEKLLVSEHIMKSLYKKNKLLQESLNQLQN